MLPFCAFQRQRDLWRQQLDNAQVARVIGAATNFVCEIEHAKSPLADRDGIANERLGFVSPLRLRGLAKLIDAGNQRSSFFHN